MDEVPTARLARESLTALRGTRFYVVTRTRNAWHATTVKHYRGETSLNETFFAATVAAEGWRAQGSTFVIEQVPGILLVGETTRVAMVEFHSSSSFSGWALTNAPVLKRGVSLRHAAEALGANSSWETPRPDAASWVSGLPRKRLSILDAADYRPESLGSAHFMQWTSYVDEGSLAWHRHIGRHDGSGVRRVVRAYRQVNRGA